MRITLTDRILGRAQLKQELETAITAKQTAMLNLRQLSAKSSFPLVGVQRLPQRVNADIGTLARTAVENEIAFACIDIRATSLATPRLMVQKKGKDGKWENVEGHPFRRLMTRPAAGMSEFEFMEFASSSLDATGVFYAEIVRSRAGLPVELRPLDPTKVVPDVRVNVDGSKQLVGYKWRDGMYQTTILPDDMLVRRERKLSGYKSRLAAAMNHVDADNAQTDYIRAFFNNAGVPSGIIKVLNRTIDVEESDALRSQWRAKYGRQWGNQHDVAVLDENAEYQKIGSGLEQLDSETLRGVAESRISMVFQVPPLIIYSYIGLTRATYSNLDEAWAQFWKTAMAAVMRGWRSWFIYALLTEFEDENDVLDEKVRLAWDTSDVWALNEDENTSHQRVLSAFTNNGITLDEYRELTKRPPFYDANVGQMLIAEIQSRFSQQTAVAKTNGGGKSDGAEERRLLKAAWQRKQKAWAEREQLALSEYQKHMKALAERAQNGELGQEEYEQQMLDLAVMFLLAMFLLGARLKRDEVTDEERAALAVHIEAHQTAVVGLATDIYSGRYDEENDPDGSKLNGRLLLWVGGAAAVLTLGRTWRRDNPRQIWRRDPSKDSCRDCVERDGMIKTAEQWRKETKIPRSTALECHGVRCGCDLYEVEYGG